MFLELQDSVGKESACTAGDMGSIPRLEDLLEEGVATQSSILAWRIPWTEEPGGLQFMGSPRVDTAEVTEQQQSTLGNDFMTLLNENIRDMQEPSDPAFQGPHRYRQTTAQKGF